MLVEGIERAPAMQTFGLPCLLSVDLRPPWSTNVSWFTRLSRLILQHHTHRLSIQMLVSSHHRGALRRSPKLLKGELISYIFLIVRNILSCQTLCMRFIITILLDYT